jgi:PPM family protein phosphatase
MQLEHFQITNPGDRETNQDSMAHIIENDYALFIVADGLGGHRAGEQASQFFCQGMLDCAKTYSKKIADDPAAVFSEWVNEAINVMQGLFVDDNIASQAHTTCAILYLDDQLCMTAHCGDSRVYRMNPKEILWRTRDHSIPQDLLDLGAITEEELVNHPQQNQLTRSINVNRVYPIEIKLYPVIEQDETFVLCSDGFWGHIKQDELLQLADLNSNYDKLNRLSMLSIYRANGNGDNVTVIAVRCRKD